MTEAAKNTTKDSKQRPRGERGTVLRCSWRHLDQSKCGCIHFGQVAVTGQWPSVLFPGHTPWTVPAANIAVRGVPIEPCFSSSSWDHHPTQQGWVADYKPEFQLFPRLLNSRALGVCLQVSEYPGPRNSTSPSRKCPLPWAPQCLFPLVF